MKGNHLPQIFPYSIPKDVRQVLNLSTEVPVRRFETSMAVDNSARHKNLQQNMVLCYFRPALVGGMPPGINGGGYIKARTPPVPNWPLSDESFCQLANPVLIGSEMH